MWSQEFSLVMIFELKLRLIRWLSAHEFLVAFRQRICF